MQDKFKSSFGEYLLSRIQASVDEHARNTPAYKRMREINKNMYELAEEIIEGLPHDDRETMIEYFDSDFTIGAEEEVLIYNQGMKDCISILQYLEVL